MPDFRFSLPAITALYPDQQLAYNPRGSMLVTGGPGSGKTVVTIFRFLRSVREDNDIMLFTYHKTLIYTIKGMLKAKAEELFGELNEDQINDIVEHKLATFFQWHWDNIGFFRQDATNAEVGDNFGGYITGPTRDNQRFDELFFDEGQDLPGIVYNNVGVLTGNVTVGADRAQNYKQYYPVDEVEDIILDGLREQIPTERQYLGGNHRNTRQIFELAKQFVPNDLRVQAMDSSTLRSGNNPEIVIGLNDQAQLDYIRQVIVNNPNSNIGILCHFGNEVEKVKLYLEQNDYSCAVDVPDERAFSCYWYEISRADEAALRIKFRTPFITTFESCKGLEFDIVIMPFFESSNNAMRRMNRDGRPWATRSHYYVAVTRAKSDIYILCRYTPNSMSFYNEENRQNILNELL